MEKIKSLIAEIGSLQNDLQLEQGKILSSAKRVLQKKIKDKDVETENLQRQLIQKQEMDFSSLNLKREGSKSKLDWALNQIFGRNHCLNDSEHWFLFAAISKAKTESVRILEIGTADGTTSALLALLFPDSEIVTIDLPKEDKKFRASYNRMEIADTYVEKRDKLLKRFSNINFLELNSIRMGEWTDQKFDLIWVDGAHGYPVLPIDLHNACRLINDGGYIAVDDVFLELTKSDEMYRSMAAIETLKLFKDNKIIDDFKLLRKRLGLEFNFKNLNEKFLAIIPF